MYIIAREGCARATARRRGGDADEQPWGWSWRSLVLGIPFARAKVGDRYVLEKTAGKAGRIGAENSGHVILLDKNDHWRRYCSVGYKFWRRWCVSYESARSVQR